MIRGVRDERPLNDAVKVKPGEKLQGKPQDGHVTDMRHAEESCVHGGELA